ncbi:MAG: tRNA-intron lyase [Candidatus Thorarchaeota archaeon]
MSLSDENPEDISEDDIDEIPSEEDLEPIEPVEVTLSDGKVYVDKDNADRISQQGFYGTMCEDGRLELSPVETLHLLERKRISIRGSNGERVSADHIVRMNLMTDPDLWTNYLVFRDLRSRGYAVRQGFGNGLGFRVYARGEKPGSATANQMVYVLREGEPVNLHTLDMITQATSAARKKLVFALVDQNGEVNYYKVGQALLQNRVGEHD